LLAQGLDLAVQQAAAVAFKNYVKYHWVSLTHAKLEELRRPNSR